MSVKFQNYHKNIRRIKDAVFEALSCQKKREANPYYSIVSSFFCKGNDGDEKPNIYVNWYSFIPLKEANAISINIENVFFSIDVQYRQKAKSIYNIDFFASGNNYSEAVDKVL